MVEETSETIVRSTPEREILAFDNLLDLVRQWCSVLLLVNWFCRTNGSHALFLDLNNVALDLGKFFRIPPDISPVLVADTRSRTSTNSIEHPLSGVGIGWTVSTVTMEVP